VPIFERAVVVNVDIDPDQKQRYSANLWFPVSESFPQELFNTWLRLSQELIHAFCKFSDSTDSLENYYQKFNRPNLKYDPTDFYYNGEVEGKQSSRFFVIKSYSKEDVVHARNYGIWCSTVAGNMKLDEAFKQTREDKNMSVYLFFSINSSGQFCGMAEMISSVDYNSDSQIWSQNKWKGKFDIRWIYIKNIPNSALRHIILPNNENKPVTNSRDTQEIPFEQAIQVLNVFRTTQSNGSILDEPDLDAQFDYNKLNKYNKYQQYQNTKTSNDQQYKKMFAKNDQVKAKTSNDNAQNNPQTNE
jgi:hypothetical protein